MHQCLRLQSLKGKRGGLSRRPSACAGLVQVARFCAARGHRDGPGRDPPEGGSCRRPRGETQVLSRGGRSRIAWPALSDNGRPEAAQAAAATAVCHG